MNVPSMGDSITEGTLVEWSKEVGDYVEQDEVLVILETDKVTVEVRAEAAGEVTEHLAGLNDTVEVGAPLVRINTGAEPPEGGSAPAPSSAPESSSEGEKKDEGKSSAPAPAPAPSPAPAPAPAPSPSPSPAPAPAPAAASGDREESRVKMSRMRLRIAERLKDAQNTAAMLTTFQECDMGALIDLRKKHKEEFEKKHGVRLGFMSAFIKASTQALLENPAVNAYIDGGDIVHRNYCDVSVAVASPRGLVVPVIRNAEKMSFAEVEGTLAGLAAKAREDNIALEDMAGGSFTISNGGVFGSLMGTPILNYPQSAILGMHATKPRPVVVDGKVEIRPMMYLALTYDHRLIDGREAVTFLKSVSDKISDPARLLLEL